MSRGQIIDLLIQIRERCYNENIVIASEHPDFYGAITQMILILSEEE